MRFVLALAGRVYHSPVMSTTSPAAPLTLHTMTKPIPHVPFLCADFLDAQGVRFRSFAQVGENGKSYAIADFEGRECVRVGSTLSKRTEAASFFQACADLVNCSNRDKMAIRWESAPDYVAAPLPRGELVTAPLFSRN